MNTAIIVADFVIVVGFSVGLVLALTVRTDSTLVTKPVRFVFAAAMALYMLVGVSNVLEYTGVTVMLDPYEDYAEALFVPAMAWVASAVYLNHQIDIHRRIAHAMSSQNDLLLSIMDTVPGGVIVVDTSGGISFANQGAERILGLRSDSLGTLHLTPSWTLRDPMTGMVVTLRDIANSGEVVRQPYVAEWPDHQSTPLALSATPMASEDGSPGGSVVAFEDVSGR